MKRLISSTITNAVCLSAFSAFYFLVFLLAPQIVSYQKYAAYILLAVTVFAVCLIIRHKGGYDEYHTSILMQCLAIALVITIIAVAILFLVILRNPGAVLETMMLFITLHWSSVVACDLIYVLICGRR